MIYLTYSIVPSFEKSTSVHIQIENGSGKESKVWYQFGGLGNDCIVATPWWIDFRSDPTEPEMLECDLADQIVQSIKGASILALPSGEIGLDGTMYELEFRAGFNQVQYKWWCDLPREWLALSNLANILNSFIDLKRQYRA